ncbi:hypothetical protein [Tepidimonas sp.]|uniref:hypothetical protein n=1 Tax=Tepidimonas sp. TaxID=2002775 RepID=UPI0028D7B88A|nr:hypothetical protein [Tepidimonas sp.]
MPTRALVVTRHLLRGALQCSFEQPLEVGRDLQSALGRTHDDVEGVTAFLQTRAPQFRGE